MKPKQELFKSEIEEALASTSANSIEFVLKKGCPTWSFCWSDGTTTWPLRLQTPTWSLCPLPYLDWIQTESVWGFPHVASDGSICVIERDGLDYDPENIRGVIETLVRDSTKLLTKYQAMPIEERLTLFADELEAYAHNLGVNKCILDQNLSGDEETYAEISLKNRRNQSSDVFRVGKGVLVGSEHSKVKVPIVTVNICQFPVLSKDLDDSWWILFVNSLTEEQSSIVLKKDIYGVVLRVNNKYGASYFMLYWGKQHRANFRKLYVLTPAYHDFITRRVGGESISRRIAIAGLGSVGSRVAEHLVLSGIKDLTLIDPDKMSVNNLGRHILGEIDVGLNKVNALAVRLANRMPGVKITPIALAVQEWINANAVNNLDYLVLATGDAPTERAIIRRAWREKWKCHIVSTFVEAGGLGGHAILMLPGQSGCLECLYEKDDNGVLHFQPSLVEKGQTVTVELSGCGAFTPYSSSDAVKTSLLAVELIMEYESPAYTRWVGSGKQAFANGIRPSECWHKLRSDRLKRSLLVSDFKKESCVCCSS